MKLAKGLVGVIEASLATGIKTGKPGFLTEKTLP
jgi:hypothetical protein